MNTLEQLRSIERRINYLTQSREHADRYDPDEAQPIFVRYERIRAALLKRLARQLAARWEAFVASRPERSAEARALASRVDNAIAACAAFDDSMRRRRMGQLEQSERAAARASKLCAQYPYTLRIACSLMRAY